MQWNIAKQHAAARGIQAHVCNTLGTEQTAVSSALKLKASLRDGLRLCQYELMEECCVCRWLQT